MRLPRVKLNLSNGLPLALTLLAVLSFLVAWSGLLPSRIVEDRYSRGVFPALSRWITPLSGWTSWSLMDLLLPGGAVLLAYLLYRRRPLAILGTLSASYMIFFWSWGVNYHRLPVETKLDYRPELVNDDSVAALVAEAAGEINAAYAPEGAADATLVGEADARVRAVVEAIDGIGTGRWGRPVRIKTSRVLNPFFRASGITGMFNPFGHEPLVTGGLLPVERPMVILHEIAHVRGYANEGEANFIALLAALQSDDRAMRYSGWLSLWMYLRSRENDRLLDPGPLMDLEAIDRRIRDSRIEWVSRTQGRTFDAFLKANRVPGGIRSYARIVQLVIGTRHSWSRFE